MVYKSNCRGFIKPAVLNLFFPSPLEIFVLYFTLPFTSRSEPSPLINRLVITFDYGYYDYGNGDDDDNALYSNNNFILTLYIPTGYII